jgi:hypothetical protein
MNQIRLPKEVLPDWAFRDKQGRKGDRVKWDKQENKVKFSSVNDKVSDYSGTTVWIVTEI